MLTYKDLLLAGPEAVCVLGTKLKIRECSGIGSRGMTRDLNLSSISLIITTSK